MSDAALERDGETYEVALLLSSCSQDHLDFDARVQVLQREVASKRPLVSRPVPFVSTTAKSIKLESKSVFSLHQIKSILIICSPFRFINYVQLLWIPSVDAKMNSCQLQPSRLLNQAK